MSGQEPTTTGIQETLGSVCPHLDAVGKRWGDPISEERQAELKALADKQQGWASRPATKEDSHFKGVVLTGADVFWLATYALAGLDATADALEAAQQRLRTPSLSDPARAWPAVSRLHLEGASTIGVHLEGAALAEAHLEGINLWLAHLDGASLRSTHLESASLYNAHLEAAYLVGAYLGETNLSGAYMDNSTTLRDATLTATKVVDIRWGGANWGGINLSTVAGTLTPPLGDEEDARNWRSEPLRADPTRPRPTRAERRAHRVKQKAERIRLYRAAVRANRQLAVTLRSQGLNEDADRFAYRAQYLQRQVLRRQGHLLSALGSLFLDLISGYGYKPMRSLITYLLVVGAFAFTYYLLGNNVQPPLDPLGALVFSITSFHGRGFAPGENVAITNPITVLAACEAIIGLLIEITFIATFTQRFFAR